MNILYVNWNCLGAEDAVETLQELGHSLYGMELSDQSHISIDEEYIDLLGKRIKEYKIELVFSFNFFPTISEGCMRHGVKYMAWIYDNPCIKGFTPNIANGCNYIFTFDSAMYQSLKNQGVSTIYYKPLAVNTKRLSRLQLSFAEKEKYQCDVAFVGSLYNETHHLYERLLKQMGNDYCTGYLDGLMEAQMKVFGYSFLAECLPEELIDKMNKAMPYRLEEGSFTTLKELYADYYLCRRMAFLERSRILTILAEQYKVFLYTNNQEANLEGVWNKGKVNYFTEMPKVFQTAKINLNITLRSIKSGIPLRAMDILGAGGFLLTNYQEDFLLHFDPDKDFVYYGSIEELSEKTAYYKKHDIERKRIAANGKMRIEKDHTYVKRLQEMLTIICME